MTSLQQHHQQQQQQQEQQHNNNNGKPWVVVKFGGTSVSSLGAYRSIAARAQTLLEEGYRVWIVQSAVSQVTNKLLACLDECLASQGRSVEDARCPSFRWIVDRHRALAKDLGLVPGDTTGGNATATASASGSGSAASETLSGSSSMDEEDPLVPKEVALLHAELYKVLGGICLTGEVSPRLRARVLAFGELISTHFALCVLPTLLSGVDAAKEVRRVDARDLLVSTERPGEAVEDRFLEAEVIPSRSPEQCEKVAGGPEVRVVITQGFIARTPKGGFTCILGRGGSDTSGALFAALTGAIRCEIWTDVHGMFTCDPRLVPEARIIHVMSYREGQEIAAMGAKVLHPRCIGPCNWARIPLVIRNTMDPDSSAITTIGGPVLSSEPRVLAVAKRTEQVLITIENFDMWGASGFLARVFAPFAKFGVSVSLIATSEYAVSMTLDHIPGGVKGQVFAELISDLETLAPPGGVQFEAGCAVVSIVGRKLRGALHMLSQVFEVVGHGDWGIRMVTESAEDLNMSFVVGKDSATGTTRVDELCIALHRKLDFAGPHFGDTWTDICKAKAARSDETATAQVVRPPEVITPASVENVEAQPPITTQPPPPGKQAGDAVLGTPRSLPIRLSPSASSDGAVISSVLGAVMPIMSLDSAIPSAKMPSPALASSVNGILAALPSLSRPGVRADHGLVFSRVKQLKIRAESLNRQIKVLVGVSDVQDENLVKAVADAQVDFICQSLSVAVILKEQYKVAVQVGVVNAFDSNYLAEKAASLGCEIIPSSVLRSLSGRSETKKTILADDVLSFLEETQAPRKGTRSHRWANTFSALPSSAAAGEGNHGMLVLTSAAELTVGAKALTAVVIKVNREEGWFALDLMDASKEGISFAKLSSAFVSSPKDSTQAAGSEEASKGSRWQVVEFNSTNCSENVLTEGIWIGNGEEIEEGCLVTFTGV